jgi:hypothetical protein
MTMQPTPQPPPGFVYEEVPKVDAKVAVEQMAGLRDIAVPEPVSWRPQTAGWFIVLALLLAGAAAVVARLVRRWKNNRYRRLAVAELAAIEKRMATAAERPAALRAMAELVKRTRLCEVDRPVVASLSGEAWLQHLDRTWHGTSFTTGPGRLLADVVYRRDEELAQVSADDTSSLVSLVRQWTRGHDAAAR